MSGRRFSSSRVVSRGLHRLKGVPDEWELLAVEASPPV